MGDILFISMVIVSIYIYISILVEMVEAPS